MAKTEPVAPVKVFVAVLWACPEACDTAIARLQERWGEIDFAGPDRLFDATRYYEPEMGTNLQRRLVAFRRLIPPEHLRQAKLMGNEIEDQLSSERGRRVNLDVGYLDHNKIVLASMKYAGQKIHLGDGVYADLIARYGHGRYQPFEWTFPDFKAGRYDVELSEMRRIYLNQLRAARQGTVTE
jgi:hypothetical protein